MNQFYYASCMLTLQLKRLGITLFVLGSFVVAHAQPTDNPYATKYSTANHWTSELPWANVHSILSYGAIADDNQDDLAAVQNAINTLTASGGGVLFFPAGTYNFSDDLIMKTGVILRGETPAVADAKNDGFAPTSRMAFPKYEPSFSGTGTDNATAFKVIHNEEGASNIGLVYLDINRAALKLSVPLGNIEGYSTPQPLTEMKNVLIFGVRNNNVAIPEPNFPKTSQNQWQRFSYRFGVNIEVFVTENGVVCNSRVNDFTNNTTAPIEDDSYDQPGYIAEGTLTGSDLEKPSGAKSGGSTTLANGEWAKFNYAAHYGIEVNRGKPYQTYGTPTVEPSLYAKGIEVNDNWVYTTRRIGITASGDGLVINGNVKKDLNGKRNYLTVNGDKLNTNNSATLENRGIDWAGTNVTVTNNDIEVYQDALMYSGVYSVDGEGILIQECCGGSVVDGINISDNTLTGSRAVYIGIYKMRDSKNIIIRNNIFNVGGGFPSVYVQADINNNPDHRLDNVLIEGNVGAKGITVKGSGGGSNVVIKNNSGSGDLKYSCYAVVENNTGFADTPCTVADLPKISSFSPASAPVGADVTIIGSDFALVNEVFFAGLDGDLLAPDFIIAANNGNDPDTLVVKVPAGSLSGSIKVKVPGSSSGLPNPAVSKDDFLVGNVLTISTADFQLTQDAVVGYDNIVVTNGGEGILTDNIALTGKTVVQTGGRIDFKNFALAGSIFQADSASLISIGSTDGITKENTGNVITFTRRYDADVNYRYSGTAAQATGNGLSGTVGSLIFANSDATAPVVTLTNNITVNGDITLMNGMLQNNNRNISLKGNWINNSSLTAFVPGSGTVTFSGGSGNQQLAGSYATTFAKLTTKKSTGDVLVITPTTVTNSLTLTTGDLVLGSNILTLTDAASISGGNANSYIQADAGGKVIQYYTAVGATITLPLGDATAYSPLTHTLVSGTLSSASVAYTVTVAAHPQKVGSLDNLSRYFSLTATGITDAMQTLSFTYQQADVNGNEDVYSPARYDGTVWSQPAGNVDPEENVVHFDDVTAFGDFTAGRGFGLPASVITFAPIDDKTVGDPDFALNATATSGLQVDFSLVSGTEILSVTGNQVTIISAGRVTISANQGGNELFNSAMEVTQSFCVNPAKPTATLVGGDGDPVLQSNAAAGNQWYKNGVAIEGATDPTLTVFSVGSFTVKATVETCESAVSDPYAVVITEVIQDEVSPLLQLHPNPATDKITIKFSDTSRKSIAIYQVNGAVKQRINTAKKELEINLEQFSAGYYLVRVTTQKGIYYSKLIKN